jgi:3'-phosphoadenosine 5'-phosphosulfate sulfotransferase (PAPS reductase)/FAD synthetase
MSRIISWFSCGAASAVATKLAISSMGGVTVAYCEVKEEHPDNKRFLKDCEQWFGQEIIILGNDKYNRSIYEVFNKTRYLAGHSGARCTLELKKNVRKQFERPTDQQVFGYTVEEQNRVDRFIDANNEVDLITPLIDRGLTKQDCLAMLENAGIELPAMYKLGYKNNNCRGCVKAQSPAYWKKIQIDFPDFFEAMSKQEQKLGVKICKTTIDGVPDVRIPLTELPEHIKPMDDSIDAQCGIFCHMAEDEYK